MFSASFSERDFSYWISLISLGFLLFLFCELYYNSLLTLPEVFSFCSWILMVETHNPLYCLARGGMDKEGGPQERSQLLHGKLCSLT